MKINMTTYYHHSLEEIMGLVEYCEIKGKWERLQANLKGLNRGTKSKP